MKHRAKAVSGGGVSVASGCVHTGNRTSILNNRLNFPKGDQLRRVVRFPNPDSFSVIALAGARVLHCVLLNYTHRLGLPSPHAITTRYEITCPNFWLSVFFRPFPALLQSYILPGNPGPEN
jgi:hypothetical protein